jgi:hypothetical protein
MTKKTKEQIALETLEAYMAGLDEKKLNTSDNRILGIQFRESNGWKEKNERRRKEDPNYDKRVGSKIKKTYENPILRECQRQKTLGYKHTPQALEIIKQSRSEQVFDTKARKKMSQSATGNQRRAKTIVTPEGIFSSKKLAGEHYTSIGILNAVAKIDKWLKIDSDNFYFIDDQGNRLPLEKQNRKKK